VYRCGARLRIVAFITPAQRAVIEGILRHRGLWESHLVHRRTMTTLRRARVPE
jgi:hypothetical protein